MEKEISALPIEEIKIRLKHLGIKLDDKITNEEYIRNLYKKEVNNKNNNYDYLNKKRSSKMNLSIKEIKLCRYNINDSNESVKVSNFNDNNNLPHSYENKNTFNLNNNYPSNFNNNINVTEQNNFNSNNNNNLLHNNNENIKENNILNNLNEKTQNNYNDNNDNNDDRNDNNDNDNNDNNNINNNNYNNIEDTNNINNNINNLYNNENNNVNINNEINTNNQKIIFTPLPNYKIPQPNLYTPNETNNFLLSNISNQNKPYKTEIQHNNINDNIENNININPFQNNFNQNQINRNYNDNNNNHNYDNPNHNHNHNNSFDKNFFQKLFNFRDKKRDLVSKYKRHANLITIIIFFLFLITFYYSKKGINYIKETEYILAFIMLFLLLIQIYKYFKYNNKLKSLVEHNYEDLKNLLLNNNINIDNIDNNNNFITLDNFLNYIKNKYKISQENYIKYILPLLQNLIKTKKEMEEFIIGNEHYFKLKN